MKIYLIRHGETDWNKKKLLQGQVNTPLNENGIAVARMTAEGLRSVHFDLVYSSPLKRAYMTAELVTEGRYDILTDERIQEMGFGPFEGYCISKEGYNVPDPSFKHYFTRPDLYVNPEGAESFYDVCKRTGAFMQDLIENPENRDKTILVSTHGAALRGLLAFVKKLPISEFWKGGVHRNCAVTILDVTDGVITIEQENVIYYDEALSTNYD